MTKLEELIEKLCPDGVEYKELKNIIKSLNTGLNPRKFFKLNTEDAKNYYVTIREIRDNKIVFSDSTDKINDNALRLCNNRSNLEVGDILFSGTGTIGMTALIDKEPMNWNIKEGVYAIKPYSNIIDSKFLMYMLQSNKIKKECLKHIFGGTVKSISMKDLMSIKLPVPPLAVQQEIVRILDNFTFLTTELAAELAARQKQYEYYRDLLLTFKLNEGTILNERTNELELSSAIRWMKLGDICLHSYSGATPKKSNDEYYTNGTIPWIRTQDVVFNNIYKVDAYITEKAVQETGAKWIPENCVIVAISGASAGRCAINKIKATTNQHCLNMEIDSSKALYKYVFYCLCNQEEELILKKQGARGDLNSSIILGMKIPIPPLEQQQRIVGILDRFDTLCNDISSGLPAEIEMRQKQYEYYRDKLLTFKELKKEA